MSGKEEGEEQKAEELVGCADAGSEGDGVPRVLGHAALAVGAVHRPEESHNPTRVAAGVGVLQIGPNAVNIPTLLLRLAVIELSASSQPRQSEKDHGGPDHSPEQQVVMPNAHDHIEVEKQQEENGKEQSLISYMIPEVICLSCLGIHSKLTAASMLPIIIIGVWQLSDRMKVSPYFS